MVSTVGRWRGMAVGPASAKPYPPPRISLLCLAAANDGTLDGSVWVLPFGVTTAPNNYSAAIAVGRASAAGATVTFAVTAGSPGMVGGAYAQDFFLSGGVAPYSWTVASGQLPPGRAW